MKLNPFEHKIKRLKEIINSMLSYPNWSERPNCKQLIKSSDEWSIRWEQLSTTYSLEDLRRVFLKFTENQFLYKFLSVKTGNGFEKIILNKSDTNLTKCQIRSVYRSNSVSKHWKNKSLSEAVPKTQRKHSAELVKLNILDTFEESGNHDKSL